jgi:hypothetical protein
MSWLVIALAATLFAPVASAVRAQDTIQSEPDSTDGAIAHGSGEMKTMAVVAIAPYKTLLNDISFLGGLAGQEQLGQQLEGGLSFFTQGKGPQALDQTKPWGIIVQTDGASLSPTFCLPVKNMDDLLAVAVAWGSQLNDGEDGVKNLALPNGQTIYVKEDGGFAFISQSDAALANLPKEPETTFAKLLTEYDVAANVSVKDIPEGYRQFAIQAMQAGMQQQLEQQSDESDEDYEARRGLAEAQMQQMVQMINEIESFTLGWSVDAEQSRTYFDFMYLVQPGSKLARQLTAYDDTRTNFAGFYQADAAATATISMKADPKIIEEDIEQFNAGMQQMRAQFNKGVDENVEDNEEMRAAIKSAAADWFDALEATMKAGRFDGGASVLANSDTLTLVAGAHVKDPEKLVDGLKKMEAAARKKEGEKAPKIEWDAEKHEGVTFHTLSVPIPEDQEAPRRVFGEKADIALGIGKDAAYLAIGKDHLEAAKKAIQESADQPEKPVPPFELAISLAPIMELATTHAEGKDREIMEAVTQMLRNEADGRDHVRIVGRVVPNGLLYRMEAEEGVLRAIGKATTEKQRQMMEDAQKQAQ